MFLQSNAVNIVPLLNDIDRTSRDRLATIVRFVDDESSPTSGVSKAQMPP
jgi:hypothetical protein